MTGRRTAEPGILVVGEAIIDLVLQPGKKMRAMPGGSPANVAVALGRLDRQVTLATHIGADTYGAQLRAWLEEAGVRILALGNPEVPTATATANLDGDGSASYDFDIVWDIGPIDVRAPVIHVGSIAALRTPGASQVLRLLDESAPGVLVSYDPNIRPSLIEDHASTLVQVEELVSRANLVKASEEDLVFLYPGRDTVEMAREWCGRGPDIVIVTRGPDGATAITATETIRVPGLESKVVDTVGAGDTFMAAIIDGLLAAGSIDDAPALLALNTSSRSLEEILARAARAAAFTVTRPGMDPPTRDELA